MLSEILRYLKVKDRATLIEISTELGIDQQLVQSALEELLRKGRIQCNFIKPPSCAGCSGCGKSPCLEVGLYSLII